MIYRTYLRNANEEDFKRADDFLRCIRARMPIVEVDEPDRKINIYGDKSGSTVVIDYDNSEEKITLIVNSADNRVNAQIIDGLEKYVVSGNKKIKVIKHRLR